LLDNNMNKVAIDGE